MTAPTHHRLAGLEPDNLLAFLALLGLLRALDTARPDWRARAYWDVGRQPLRPVLVLGRAVTFDAVCDAAADGVFSCGRTLEHLARSSDKLNANGPSSEISGMAGLVRDHDVYKKLYLNLTDETARLIECLCCEAQATPNPRLRQASATGTRNFEIKNTAFKFPSGQMAFVGTMVTLALNSGKLRLPISRSLSQAWTYSAKGLSLRFSPDEAKRYALQARDPSPVGAWAEHGATALALPGLVSFPMLIGDRGTKTVGVTDLSGHSVVRWPIWESPKGRGWSRFGIEGVLTNPSLHAPQIDPIWRRRMNVAWVAEALIFRLNDQGNYKNVTRASAVPER